MPYDYEAASKTMSAFYAKHGQIKVNQVKVSKEKLVSETKEPATRAFTKEEVSIVAKAVETKLKDKVIVLNAKENVHPAFKAFVGDELSKSKIKYSVNSIKARRLARAMKQGDWQNEVLAIADNVPQSMDEFIKYANVFPTHRTFSAKYKRHAEFMQEEFPVPYALALEMMLCSPELTAKTKAIYLWMAFTRKKISKKEFCQLAEMMNLAKLFKLTSPLEMFKTTESDDLSEDAQEQVGNLLQTTEMSEHHLDQIDAELSTCKLPFKKLYELMIDALKRLPVSHHIYHAMRAFKDDLISREQLSTIILRHELTQHYGKVKEIILIDDKGNFTEEGEKYLTQIIPPQFDTQECREKFRFNLLTLPKSERTVFVVDAPMQMEQIKTDRKFTYQMLPGCYIDSENKIRMLSAGAIDALQVAIYGFERAAKAQYTLGMFSLEMIEKGVENNERIIALPYPRAFNTFWVHERFYSRIAALIHDLIHLFGLSSLPTEQHEIFEKLKKQIRRDFKLNSNNSFSLWSKETFSLVDRLIRKKIDQKPEDTIVHAEEFIKCLYSISGVFLEFADNKKGQTPASQLKTAIAHNVFLLNTAIDIAFNPRWYEERNIQLDSEMDVNTSLFKNLYKHACDIKPYLENDPRHLQTIKFAFYVHFQHELITSSDVEALFKIIELAVQNDIIKVYKEAKTNLLRITFLDPEKENIIGNSQTEFIKSMLMQLAKSAAIHGNVQLMELIINYEKMKESKEDKFSETVLLVRKEEYLPFHLACQYGHSNVVSSLLKMQLNLLNKTNSQNQSALFIAARYGQEAIVALLLAKGATVEIMDQASVRPFEIALKNNHPKIAVIILNKYDLKNVPTLLTKLDINMLNSLVATLIQLFFDESKNAAKMFEAKHYLQLAVLCFKQMHAMGSSDARKQHAQLSQMIASIGLNTPDVQQILSINFDDQKKGTSVKDAQAFLRSLHKPNPNPTANKTRSDTWPSPNTPKKPAFKSPTPQDGTK